MGVQRAQDGCHQKPPMVPFQVLYRSFRLDIGCPCKVSEVVYFSPIQGPGMAMHACY